MKNIEIIKYDDSYAAAVADMWNKSGSNWGGDTLVRTAEDVIQENASMYAKAIFLAKCEDEILGFCSYGEYREDEGASYIPLLNVRTDCIGHKIGKKLVLRCVEEACNDIYPRLDLYTWQGNDKAVPLYKKCGFFWERREDTTHLMNFIPYVMGTEAVKDYFDSFNWYDDSKREIVVEADGLEEGQFEFYNYHWEKDNQSLRMEFERRGRGLTAIETEDYLIKARISKQKLVFGKDYNIEYELVNKTGKPLDVSIQGEHDKNIQFSDTFSGEIIGTKKWQGSFLVAPIEEEQSVWKTHPTVTSKVLINGKEAIFKVGVIPKFPCRLELEGLSNGFQKGEKNICYLFAENSFEEDVNITFELPETEEIKFSNSKINLSLKGNEKNSIPLKVTIKNYGFYSQHIPITVKVGEDEVKFKMSIAGAFRGQEGKYFGEKEKSYAIYNGAFGLELFKEHNVIVPSRLGYTRYEDVVVRSPQLGLPLTPEFGKVRPLSVDFSKTDDYVRMDLTFESTKRKGLFLTWQHELYGNGLCKIGFRLENKGQRDYEDLVLCQPLFQWFWNAYMPKNGGIMKVQGSDGMYPTAYDNNFDENWLFVDHTIPTGIAWPSAFDIAYNHSISMLKTKLETIKPGECVNVEPVTIAFDTFKEYSEFREYLGYSEKDLNEDFGLQLTLNKGNMFIDNEQVSIEVKENQKVEAKGDVTVQDSKGMMLKAEEKLLFDDNYAKIDVRLPKIAGMDVIKVSVDMETTMKISEHLLFSKTDNDVKITVSELENMEVYTVDNGEICLKAAPDYMAGIYSLCHNGEEYLDNMFPTPGIKAWWNFWTGGMCFKPLDVTYASMRKQKFTAVETELADNMGNNWKGIKTTATYIDHEKVKGLVVEEYYLLLPGVPVLCTFAKVHQQTGRFIGENKFEHITYMKRGKEQEGNTYHISDKHGNPMVFKGGPAEAHIVGHDFFAHGHKESATKGYYLSHGLNDGFNSNGVTVNFNQIEDTFPHGETRMIKPRYIAFTDLDLSQNHMKSLENIRFE